MELKELAYIHHLKDRVQLVKVVGGFDRAFHVDLLRNYLAYCADYRNKSLLERILEVRRVLHKSSASCDSLVKNCVSTVLLNHFEQGDAQVFDKLVSKVLGLLDCDGKYHHQRLEDTIGDSESLDQLIDYFKRQESSSILPVVCQLFLLTVAHGAKRDRKQVREDFLVQLGELIKNALLVEQNIDHRLDIKQDRGLLEESLQKQVCTLLTLVFPLEARKGLKLLFRVAFLVFVELSELDLGWNLPGELDKTYNLRDTLGALHIKV